MSVWCDDPWEGFVPLEEVSVAAAKARGWPYDENPWAADAQEITLETLVEANFSAFKGHLKLPFPDYGDFDFGEVGLPEIEAV